MRPINVTLDSQTWELAKQKKNFSEWVRNQLRKESSRDRDLSNALDDSDYWQERYRELKSIIFKEKTESQEMKE